uniref:sentrin-specific protease 6-like isoform X2 n=1 Tax=Myxine glutinosa TaxID=7769 RepID=UPI00358F376C
MDTRNSALLEALDNADRTKNGGFLQPLDLDDDSSCEADTRPVILSKRDGKGKGRASLPKQLSVNVITRSPLTHSSRDRSTPAVSPRSSNMRRNLKTSVTPCLNSHPLEHKRSLGSTLLVRAPIRNDIGRLVVSDCSVQLLPMTTNTTIGNRFVHVTTTRRTTQSEGQVQCIPKLMLEVESAGPVDKDPSMAEEGSCKRLSVNKRYRNDNLCTSPAPGVSNTCDPTMTQQESCAECDARDGTVNNLCRTCGKRPAVCIDEGANATQFTSAVTSMVVNPTAPTVVVDNDILEEGLRSARVLQFKSTHVIGISHGVVVRCVSNESRGRLQPRPPFSCLTERGRRGLLSPKFRRNGRRSLGRPQQPAEPIVLSSDEEEEERKRRKEDCVKEAIEECTPQPECLLPDDNGLVFESDIEMTEEKAKSRSDSLSSECENPILEPTAEHCTSSDHEPSLVSDTRSTPEKDSKTELEFLSALPPFPPLLTKKARMKDEFGQLALLNDDQQKVRSKQASAMQPSLTSEPEKGFSLIMQLQCRFLRLGSLKVLAQRCVTVCGENVTFKGPVDDSPDLILPLRDVLSWEHSSARHCSAFFLRCTPSAAHGLRCALRMTKCGDYWFEPSSQNERERYIIFILNNPLDPSDLQHLQAILNFESERRSNGVKIFRTLSDHEGRLRLIGSAEDVKKFHQRSSSGEQNTEGCDQIVDLAGLVEGGPGAATKLVVYPPPPAVGGMVVTREDLACLDEGEFVNDVIIDFYLKYLVSEKLPREDSSRIHIFSSFFYQRLSQRGERDSPRIPIQKRRHMRVRTWTRHVDLFSKELVFVPINEAAHWFLAVIRFPARQNSPTTNMGCRQSPDPASGGDLSEGAPGVQELEKELQESGKTGENRGEGNEEMASAEPAEDETPASCDLARRKNCSNQPCILIMDSLNGASRAEVTKTLRGYLEEEWFVRKGSRRMFSKDTIRGFIPKVPQQDNYSDCGIYLLQFVESFFESPIPSFEPPLVLDAWFTQERVKRKREEIQTLILRLSEEQCLKGAVSERVEEGNCQAGTHSPGRTSPRPGTSVVGSIDEEGV